MIKFDVTNRFTGAVQFTAEIDCAEDAPRSIKLGLAVHWGIKARANLADASLAGAYLARANLAGAYLARANLTGANLADASLADASLADASLADAILADAYLADASLAGAYLARANLAGAYLDGAYLARANLAGAYLARANLTGANLADAILTGASLEGAYLARANLTGANLDGAYLAGAKWRDGVVINRVPLQLYGLDYSVTILDAHMQIGCELHSLAEWEAFDNERIAKMDGTRSRRFWDANRDALLALARADNRSFATSETQEEAA